MPRFITFAEPALSLSSVKETYCCYNASEWTNLCAYYTFSEIEGQQAYSRSFFCCSSNNSQSFFIFHYIVLFSSTLWKFLSFIRITFCTQIVLFTRCEVENDNCRQWLQDNWLFSGKQLPQLDLTEASKTNPYVQSSVFSNDRLSLICLKLIVLRGRRNRSFRNGDQRNFAKNCVTSDCSQIWHTGS